MTDFIYTKIKTADVLSNTSGTQFLFGFAVADYIVHLQSEGKEIPETITIIGVTLDESDTHHSIENFANMIENNPGCDMIIFNHNSFPEEYNNSELYELLLVKNILKELPDVYDDQAVFYRVDSEKDKTETIDLLKELKELKEICASTALEIANLPKIIFAAQKKGKWNIDRT